MQVNINDFDFVVEIPQGEQARILQLTDIQVIDSHQRRRIDRLCEEEYIRWSPDNKDWCYKDCLTAVIQQTCPHLIIITGDVIYGEFDDNGSAFTEVVQFIDSFKIPWAPIFGNHDNECVLGVDWQCEQFLKSKYCLFKQRQITGNGNYNIAVVQNGVVKRAFYMVDSNGCYGISEKTLNNGHSTAQIGFGADQIEWYSKGIKRVKEKYNCPVSMAFHIQLAVFQQAYDQLGLTIPTDLGLVGNDGNFGYLGAHLKSAWDQDNAVWEGIKQLGVDSIFVGHEHQNSISVIYQGVRLQYGQKSSAYDRYNSDDNGPSMGGTFFTLDEKGVIRNPKIVLYKKSK